MGVLSFSAGLHSEASLQAPRELGDVVWYRDVPVLETIANHPLR